MLRVALDLREEAKHFRTFFRQVEQELFSDATSVGKRIKLLTKLDELCADLWPAGGDGLQTRLLTNGAMLAQLGDLAVHDLGSPLKILNFALSKPSDFLLRALKRRSVRVLLDARRTFLRSSRHVQKLQHVFALQPDDVIAPESERERSGDSADFVT